MKGKSIGFIESTYTKGFFIHGDYISFRETNASLAPGNTIELNTRFLTPQNKKVIIDDLITKKELVYIHVKVELFTHPALGKFLEEKYITHIEKLSSSSVYRRGGNEDDAGDEVESQLIMRR